MTDGKPKWVAAVWSPRRAWCQQCMQSSREECSSHPKHCLGIEPGRRWGQDGLGQNCGCAGHVGVFRTFISILSKGRSCEDSTHLRAFHGAAREDEVQEAKESACACGPTLQCRASGRDKLCPPRLGRGREQVFLIGTLSSHGPSSALGGSFSPQAQQP